MSYLRSCLNWRAGAALGALVAVLFLWNPGLLPVALPLAILLICPLSMLLMMRAMGGSHGHAGNCGCEASPHPTGDAPEGSLAAAPVPVASGEPENGPTNGSQARAHR